jgi:prepilin-type N-terminal cleavage/methylation domain-containing protein
MKKGLTLIELIFTIVIIAAVFTTIPKIIYVSNKSLEFSKKEDAVFNMMSKIMDISLKEYDEQNTVYDDVLLTGRTPPLYLDCNSTTGYRIGGFAGGRNCKNAVLESSIGKDAGEPPYDDVDDYNGVEENTTKNGRTAYTLNITAGYTDEWGKNDYDANGNLNYHFTDTSNDVKTNIKRVSVRVSYNDKNISSVTYYSANIGHMKINGIQW